MSDDEYRTMLGYPPIAEWQAQYDADLRRWDDQWAARQKTALEYVAYHRAASDEISRLVSGMLKSQPPEEPTS